jgi:hypothetical protein
LENKKTLRNNCWVDVPMTAEVWNLLKEQRVSDTYYRRGDGQATEDLDWVEATHRNWVHEIVDLSEFPHCYFVNGTTDAIHHWKMTETREWQYHSGEYDYPNWMGTKGHEIQLETHEDKVLYLSAPFSGDGDYRNIKADCPVILDCTYVSSTNIQHIDVPKNTEQVFFSFSKGFGLVGQRLGLVYTKEPHPTLQPLKEFENWNYGGVKTIDLIMSNYKVDDMWNIHRAEQLKICEEHNFIPSDCYFLATTRDKYYRRRRRMKHNNDARICITTLFDEYK